jgi:Fe-S cluster assembly protein SufD
VGAAERYIGEAERLGRNRGTDPGWLSALRRDALARFAKLGFPTTRDEEWRFTSIAPILEGRFALADNGAGLTSEDLGRFHAAGDRAATLVFVNGHYVAGLSRVEALPSGVLVTSLGRALREQAEDVEPHLARLASQESRAFTALNTAFLDDGAFVRVPASTRIDVPIHLLFVSAGASDPTMAHPRTLVVLGSGSRATVVENYAALDAGSRFTNAVSEVAVAENAALDHVTLQQESPAGSHVAALHVRLARDAAVACHSVSLGGSLVRNEVTATLDGPGAECSLYGLYAADGQRLVDNHTTIDHAKPHCGSREVYKGILADRARGVFNGKIVVRPDAQKTDARQTNKALLLSEAAQINTKPQLEIFANDVKCTHGAAVGQLDEEAIFYLRARGLDSREARRLLIRAFAADVLERLRLDPVRAHVEAELTRRLPGWLA